MSNPGRDEYFRFLYEASLELNKVLDTDQVLECLVTLVQSRFHADAVSVVWLEADGTQVFRAVAGPNVEKLLGLRLPKGEGIAGWVAGDCEHVWIPDVSSDNRFFEGVDAHTGFRTHSIFAAPLCRAESIVAILELVNLPPDLDIDEVKNTVQALMTRTIEILERHELAQQAELYKTLFETRADPGLLITPDGYVLDANCAAQRIFDIESGKGSKIHFDALGITSVTIAGLLVQLQNTDAVYWDFVRDTGEPRTYKAMLSPLPGIKSNRLYVLSAYDITDLVALEDIRMQLFNMLVHDLRVPLASMHHSIELVMMAWKEKDITIPMDQVLEIALRSERRMERLISDILDTTRLSSQTKALTVTAIDIGALVQEAVNAVASSVERHLHKLSVHIQSGLEILHGDLDLLQRVLINILGNAVKYTPDGGDIDLVVYDDEKNFYFEVSDTGPGILLEDQPHIFELFFRGRTQRVTGTGIGLAFSKLAVEAHGGKIRLDNKVDQGAKFIFTIPKQLPESAVFFEER